MAYTGSYLYPKTDAKRIAFVVKAIERNSHEMITSRAFDSCFERDSGRDIALAVYARLGERTFAVISREYIEKILAERSELQPSLF